MKSIFDPKAYAEVIYRIDLLTETTTAQWGKMGVAQMLSHCQSPLAVALGRKSLRKSNFLMKWLMKSFKPAMYNDRPWRKGLATAKEYVVDSERDFNQEKNKLKAIIEDFHQLKTKTEWQPHPSFGHFTPDQWGMMQYKHLDHHLRQFGV
ncbi:MAG: DUF1569 domain-containing protein [Flavobacteriaceae bacterium]